MLQLVHCLIKEIKWKVALNYKELFVFIFQVSHCLYNIGNINKYFVLWFSCFYLVLLGLYTVLPTSSPNSYCNASLRNASFFLFIHIQATFKMFILVGWIMAPQKIFTSKSLEPVHVTLYGKKGLLQVRLKICGCRDYPGLLLKPDNKMKPPPRQYKYFTEAIIFLQAKCKFSSSKMHIFTF